MYTTVPPPPLPLKKKASIAVPTQSFRANCTTWYAIENYVPVNSAPPASITIIVLI